MSFRIPDAARLVSRLSLRLQSKHLSTKTKAVNAFGSVLPEVIANGGWDAAWKTGVTPWDAGRPAPLLAHLDSHAALLNLPKPRVLVPGCGSGHDTFAFASAGWLATGLDVSETAITRCTSNVKDTPAWNDLPAERLRFIRDDFFEHNATYDLIFDYAFLCSFEPKTWQRWATAVHRLLDAANG